MPVVYRKGLAEFRAAVKVALEVGATDADVTDGRWWTYQEGPRAVVATDAAIDAVILCVSLPFIFAMFQHDRVVIRDFGTFFAGVRRDFEMSGATAGTSARRYVGRFRAARAWQAAIAAMPLDNGV